MKRILTLLAVWMAVALLGGQATSQVEVLPRIERDVIYGTAGGESLQMDIYRPLTPGKKPAVIAIHGGGWRGGDKRRERRLALMLAKKNYVVFAINYRLAPQHPWPAALDDCQRAVRWVRHQANEYEVAPKRIAALGQSAGGHLSSLLGTMRQTRQHSDPLLQKPSSQVNAVVNLYGPADMVKQFEHAPTKRILLGFLGKPPTEAADVYAAASPVTHITRKSAPFLTLHGSEDPTVPVEQARLLHQALQANGVSSKLVILEGARHGWRADSEHGRRADREILEFLNRRLRKK